MTGLHFPCPALFKAALGNFFAAQTLYKSLG